MDEALKNANAILSKAPTATRMAKRAINASENTDLATGICYELETYDVAFNTEDRVEGMKAFLEKRKPQFKNK
jgi:enoyl-CoA hydratase